VLSLGERLSVQLVAAGLRQRGIATRPVDSSDLIVTDDRHVEAEVDFPATEERVLRLLAPDGTVPIVTGFLGATESGERTTLGKGGSDYSGAVLGWALRAEEVEIWTDVSGVMTADPRTVPDARPLRNLGFNELLELSHWGARVVHPKTVRPLRERGIPLSIRNTMAPSDPGTLVTPRAAKTNMGPVRGIASIDQVALLQLNGVGESVTGRFVHALDEAKCPILLLSQGCSERSVCVALAPRSVRPALRAIDKTFVIERRAGLMDDPQVEEDCSIVAVVGEGMKDMPGIAGKVFGVLGEEGISIRAIAQGSSELNISFVVRSQDVHAAVRALHEAFFGGAPTTPEATHPTATPAVTTAAVSGPLDVVDLATEMIAIPSLSGHEHAVCDFVMDLLSARGWEVRTQPVTAGRLNLWATRGGGEVTLTTHLDTVPGFFPPRIEDGKLYGRGSCDAKGIAAATISAPTSCRRGKAKPR
jgi:aspartokinase/homoserine dehydrogenase 1